jgi:S1-C subfamily serine protease
VVRSLLLVSLLAAAPAFSQGGLDKAYAKAASSVVGVRGETAEGAGVVLHGDGFIATAAHLLAQSDSVSVVFPDGSLVPARLVTVSRSEDIALIKVDKLPAGVTAAALGESEKLVIAQPIFTVAPKSRALSVGIVRTVRSPDPKSPMGQKELFQVDESLNEAGFGSAVFDSKGEVVGMLTNLSMIGRRGGVGFATPASAMKRRLFDNALPYLGTALRYISPEMAALFQWPVQNALLIEWVKPGSASANAGLQGGTVDAVIGGAPFRLGGDLIIKCGDFDMSKLDEIGAFMASRKAGSVLHYTVLRGGKQLQIDVLVEETIKVPSLKKK